MKERINYIQSDKQMGDLLESMNVSIKRDFSMEERLQLQKYLEDYMTKNRCDEIAIDLKTFYLVVKGTDEVSYLYQYVR